MQIHQLMDACIFAVSFWLAAELRASPQIIDWLNLTDAPPEDRFFWIFMFLIPAAPVILEWQGFYNRPMVAPRRMFLWPLVRSSMILTGLVILATFFLRITFARMVVLWFPLIAFGMVHLKEELLLALYKSKLGVAKARRRFLLVGASGETERMQSELDARREDDVEVVAALDLDATSTERMVQILHDHSVGGVLLSARHTYYDRVEELVHACELEGVEVWLIADFFRTQISHFSFDEFQGRPVLVFRSAPELAWQGIGKYLVDFLGALLMLTITAPLLLVVGLIVRFTSPGPILFRQQRAGLNGRPFTMYKFRTMVTNADQLKEELAALNEMSGPVFKVTNDPRVTPIGRWLRKFSLDEFPQLFNVLAGDMSLVGPRPLPVDEVARFDDLAHRRRLSVRPGLTCLWQVSGRSNVKDFRDWVRLDLEYIDNWSLWLDIKILIRTIPVVLLGSGAR